MGTNNKPYAKRDKHLVVTTLRVATKESPIKSSALEEFFGLTGAKIRAIIHDARLEGSPIASSQKGYYWARDSKELEHTIRTFKSRIAEMSPIIRALEKAYAVQTYDLFGRTS